MPKKKPELIEIASTKNDVFRYFIGDNVVNPDPVLLRESKGKGIGIYEELLRDPQVKSTLQTRRLAVIGKEWEIIPASENTEDIKIADYAKQVLKSFNYDAARQSLLSGLIMGFKPAEIMWEYSEGDVWIKEIKGKSARRFTFDLEGNLRLLTPSNLITGELVPEKKFIVFRNESDNGSYYGDGLGYNLHFPVWFKTNGMKYWIIFAEKFGSPTVLGKHPRSISEKEQLLLYDTVLKVQQETAAILPDDMAIELVEAARRGGDTYEALISFLDRQISKVILGHSASVDTTPGRLGNEKQAGDIRQDYIKADADALCECQNNSLIKWIVDYNFPDVKEYPKVWIRTEPEQDLIQLAQRDKILAKEIGILFTKKYFYDTYGMPEPQNDEETLKVLQVTPLSFPAPAFSEQGDRKELFSSQDKINMLVDNSLKKIELNLVPLQKIVDTSVSYADLQKKIKKAYGSIDMTEFRKVLEQGVFLANLQGRSLSA